MRRRAAAISARRDRTAWSGSGICMAGLWPRPRFQARPKPKRQNRAPFRARFGTSRRRLSAAQRAARRNLALAGLVARIGLVDDVDAALAADDPAVLVPRLGRFQRVDDLHDPILGRLPAFWGGRTI